MASGVRFIRVNGRIVPIKDKDPSKKQTQKNYKKHGDGARQASKIDSKYDRKASKGTFGLAAIGTAGVAGSMFLKGKKSLASLAVGLGAAAAATMKRNHQAGKLDISKEREYVRTFGMTSEGQKPVKNKKLLFKKR